MPIAVEQATRLREEVTRISSSPDFQRSPVMARLLKFLIDYCIEHDVRGPKAYTVAVEGLGKSPDFDPNSDSYPRVQVGRLRKMLAAYYADHPRWPQMQIPLGQYCVKLIEQDRDISQAMPGTSSIYATDEIPAHAGISRYISFKAILAGAALALAIAALVWMSPWQRSQATAATKGADVPRLMVAQAIAGEGVTPANVAALDSAFRDRFRRFHMVKVDAANVAAPGRKAPDYLLRPVMQRVGGELNVSLMLDRQSDATTLWSDSFSFPVGTVASNLDVSRIASQLVGDNGITAQDQLALRKNDFAPGYVCLVQYHSFRAIRDDSKLPRLTKCLEQMVEQQIMVPDALAGQSFLAFAKGFIKNDETLKAQGDALAKQAYRAGPANSVAIFALARSGFFRSDCLNAKSAGNRALEINPYDADMIGFFAVYLAGCKDPTANAMARKSIALDPARSINARSVLIFLLLRDRQYPEALQLFYQMPPTLNDDPRYALLQTLVLAVEKDQEKSRRKWASIAGRFGKSPEDVQPVLTNFISSTSTRAGLEKMLRELKVI